MVSIAERFPSGIRRHLVRRRSAGHLRSVPTIQQAVMGAGPTGSTVGMAGVPLLTLLAALASALPASAQVAATTLIGFEESVSDTLALGGDTLQDGSFFKSFMLAGKTGDTLTLTLSSPDFDVHLVLMDAQENILAIDDNGGGHCDSHINVILPSTGLHFAVALSAKPREIGAFRLSLSRGKHPPSSNEPCRGFAGPQGVVSVGDTIYGVIGYDAPILPADSTFYHVWVLAPGPEDTVTVDVLSQDFDATLFLVRGIDEVADANDDGAGGCNARLVFARPDRRPRRIIVRPAARGFVGTYLLRAIAGALPVAATSQCGTPQKPES